MRMFLTGMIDLFLILYLTAMASVQSTSSSLTVEDFYKLKAMHEVLQSDKQKAEAALQEDLLKAKKENEALSANLAKEETRAKETEASLIVSDARLSQIDKDLQSKDSMLKERERLLAALDQKIKGKEVLWQQKESSYKEKLAGHALSDKASQMLARKFHLEAERAKRLADQMQQEASQAVKTAEDARAIQQNAIILKDAALKEKADAEQRAHDATLARRRAEEEKAKAAQKAYKLATVIKDINQDSDQAYKHNVLPLIQQLHVTYEEEISNTTTVFKRDLRLLPVQINGKVFVFFPAVHIGFNRRDDTAPKGLEISYKGKKIDHGWINKEDDLVAVALPGYEGKVYSPYATNTSIDHLMPILLALRDNADVSFSNLFRGLSQEYFALHRDSLSSGKDGGLVYQMKGFRGTGTRGERVLRGDQLVDLNARFIGIAKDADRIIRIETLKGWEERTL